MQMNILRHAFNAIALIVGASAVFAITFVSILVTNANVVHVDALSEENVAYAVRAIVWWAPIMAALFVVFYFFAKHDENSGED